MKNLISLPIIALSTVFVSCGTFENLNKPISDSGISPLDSKLDTNWMKASSGNSDLGLVDENDYGFNNGEIVEVVIANTAFYDKVPKAGDQYKKILTIGDTMRVIGGEKDFIKVLTETGETGYISSVMVVTKGSLTDAGDIEPNVTVVGINETPIIPDITPDPASEDAVEPDSAPDGETSLPDPNSVPETVPAPEPTTVPKTDPPVEADPTPVLPDPKPVEPSLPEKPAGETAE